MGEVSDVVVKEVRSVIYGGMTTEQFTEFMRGEPDNRLRERLAEFVRQENYECAAIVRDILNAR